MFRFTRASIAILFVITLSSCLAWTTDQSGNLQSVGLPGVPVWTAQKPEVTPRTQGLDTNPESDADWLTELNKWREMAGTRPVGENSNLSHGCQLHAEYLADQIPADGADLTRFAMAMGADAHRESSGQEGYSEEGAQAAGGGRHVQGVLQAADVSWGQADGKEDIDGLLVVPFHRLSLLAPWAKVAGFGRAGTPPRSAAAVALRGPQADASVAGEVSFPPPGSTVPIPVMNDVEWPNPLASCPGYRTPVGLPVTVQLGKGHRAELSSHSFSDETDGVKLKSCAFDADSYRNSDPSQFKAATEALKGFGAVILIPRAPLEPGHTYRVTLNINGANDSWTFKVRGNAPAVQANMPSSAP